MTGIPDELGAARWTVRLCVGLAGALAALGLYRFMNPPRPPFSGRLGWMTEWAVLVLGPSGPAVVLGLVAIAALATARLVWRHTPKRPTDRWL